MSINVKMYNENWRLSIENEHWEFEKREEMQEVLETLIKLKSKYGKLKKVLGCN